MAGPRRKGTVTPLESQFSPEEVQNATKHVQDAIVVKNNELHQLRAFVDDNNNLVSIVQKLPEQLSHDVMASQSLFFLFFFFKTIFRFLITLCEKVSKFEMGFFNFQVPFGKAAFFPGRLIHTNEFMVRFFLFG